MEEHVGVRKKHHNVLMITALLLLGSFLCSLPESSMFISTESNEIRFAIITHPDFQNTGETWSLERLRDWHNENDSLLTYIINTTTLLEDPLYIVDGPWGDGNVSNPYWRPEENAITKPGLFNDTQAIIRNYIRYANYELNVKYVLLVGDEEKIPSRKMTVDGYGAPASDANLTYYENVPTHMYYACLDGTFNDDEDTNNFSNEVAGWGENATHNADHNIDEVDWNYEVAVGRITPDNNQELSNIIRKTIAYMETTDHESTLYKIALAGHHLGFGGEAEWGINFALQLANNTSSDWNHTTYGFDNSTYTFTYINSNPSRPEEHIYYSDDNVRSVFLEGIHVWYQCGHGDIREWNSNGHGDTWDIYDVATLENTFYPLVYGALPCLSGRWDSTDGLAEVFVNDEHGAFASIMNSRYGWGSYNDLHATSQYIGREFFDAYFNESHTRLGDMLFDALRDCEWLRNQSNGAIRWASFDQNIIGNPAVEMKLSTSPYQESLLGDVDKDSDIDIFDIVTIINAYGSNQGEPEYMEACDLNQDGKIDIQDIVAAIANYGQHL